MNKKIEIYVRLEENGEEKILKVQAEPVDDNTAIYNIKNVSTLNKNNEVQWFVVDTASGDSIVSDRYKQIALYKYNNIYKTIYDKYREEEEYKFHKKLFERKIRKAKKE